MAAELGTLKVSQEIDALTVMGIDPVSFLVLPRLLALIVALPCLTVLADVVGILGGFAVTVGVLGVGAGRYVAAPSTPWSCRTSTSDWSSPSPSPPSSA